jgi:ion channel-forming bestrophin family protein
MLKLLSNNRWNQEKRDWFPLILQLRSSVIPAIMPKVCFCAVFGILISALYSWHLPVALPILSSVVPSIVLGLLLVFRTNTAYERFWEGRKLWGSLVNTIRNFARSLWVVVEEKESIDRQQKIIMMRCLVAFAIATKLHLRQEPPDDELARFVPSEWSLQLRRTNNPPLEIAFWIGDYLQQQYQRHCLDRYQVIAMQKFLDTMVDALGGCERILRTPVPLAYAIHLKQLLLIYCLSLPFQVVKDLTWWTAPIVALISFAVFGIEEIGIEIENPFGRDPNDLPLDRICETIASNVEELISLTPSCRPAIGSDGEQGG